MCPPITHYTHGCDNLWKSVSSLFSRGALIGFLVTLWLTNMETNGMVPDFGRLSFPLRTSGARTPLPPCDLVSVYLRSLSLGPAPHRPNRRLHPTAPLGRRSPLGRREVVAPQQGRDRLGPGLGPAGSKELEACVFSKGMSTCDATCSWNKKRYNAYNQIICQLKCFLYMFLWFNSVYIYMWRYIICIYMCSMHINIDACCILIESCID